MKKAEGTPYADIVRSIQQMIYSGEYNDTTGLATRQEVNADTLREMRAYHGSGADFDAFDHSHMGEGEGALSYGYGSYVTEVEDIGRTYAKLMTRTPIGSKLLRISIQKKTPQSARKTRSVEARDIDNSDVSGTKIQQNSNTSKDSDEIIREHRVYHGSGADFDAFDHSYMGEGEGL